MRKALIFLFAFAISVAGYSQTSETYIKDANGNLVGTVSSYTNYVGATETTLYDQNGQKVGSIEGNNVTPLLGTYYTGQYTIVSGSDVSTVVLGSGTQALDYYLVVSEHNSSTYISPRAWRRINKKYPEPVIDYEHPENVSHPEYLSVKESQKNKTHTA